MVQNLKTAIFSHEGRRAHNEDEAGEYNFKSNAIGARKVLIVADGMGGYNAGEVASDLAVEKVITVLAAEIPKVKSPDDLPDTIRKAFNVANDEIFKKASSDSSFRGMGTTLCIALILNDRLLVANVGDSRIYMLADGKIRQLSEDHTALAEAMKSTEMTEEEIRNFEYHHSVTRSLGESEAPQVFIDALPVPRDAVLLLCSDGVSDVLGDNDILRQISGSADLRTATENIGRLSFHKNSADNITVMTAELGNFKRTAANVEIEKPIPKIRHKVVKKFEAVYRVALGVTIVAILATISSAGYLYYKMSIKDGISRTSPAKVVKTIKKETKEVPKSQWDVTAEEITKKEKEAKMRDMEKEKMSAVKNKKGSEKKSVKENVSPQSGHEVSQPPTGKPLPKMEPKKGDITSKDNKSHINDEDQNKQMPQKTIKGSDNVSMPAPGNMTPPPSSTKVEQKVSKQPESGKNVKPAENTGKKNDAKNDEKPKEQQKDNKSDSGSMLDKINPWAKP
jgi:PPM family protein phosphatase